MFSLMQKADLAELLPYLYDISIFFQDVPQNLSQIKIAGSINYLLTIISCIYILQSGYLGNIKV